MNVEDLKNASIVSNGSTVTINCAPKNSCVVIYVAYGNDTLNIFTKMFPLHLSLNPDNYSFALFKRKDHNDIDERPFMNKFLVVERAKSSSPPAFGKINSFGLPVKFLPSSTANYRAYTKESPHALLCTCVLYMTYILVGYTIKIAHYIQALNTFYTHRW